MVESAKLWKSDDLACFRALGRPGDRAVLTEKKDGCVAIGDSIQSRSGKSWFLRAPQFQGGIKYGSARLGSFCDGRSIDIGE